MTIEKAIEFLQVGWTEDNGAIYIGAEYARGYNNALNMALSALRVQQEAEKNDPLKHGHAVWKERTTGGYKYLNAKCQICGSTVNVEVSHPMEHDKVPYCSECGKRLDDRFMNYCPACGVPIDSEETHNV